MTTMLPKLYNVRQSAEYLGVTPRTVQAMLRNGDLLGKKLSVRGDWRILEDELLQFAGGERNAA